LRDQVRLCISCRGTADCMGLERGLRKKREGSKDFDSRSLQLSSLARRVRRRVTIGAAASPAKLLRRTTISSCEGDEKQATSLHTLSGFESRIPFSDQKIITIEEGTERSFSGNAPICRGKLTTRRGRRSRQKLDRSRRICTLTYRLDTAMATDPPRGERTRKN